MSIQAMKQALEALGNCESMLPEYHQWLSDAQYEVRAAIEAAEKCEPACFVGSWWNSDKGFELYGFTENRPEPETPLYTHPQPAIPAEWRHKLEHIIACAKLWDETGISRVKAITREAEAMLAAAPKPENSHD